MADVGNFTGTMIGLLFTAILFTALLPVVIDQLNTLEWNALNVSGEVKDFSWVPYVVIIGYVLIFIALPIGAVVKLFKGM